jgi:hypothetical protein
MRSVVPFAAVVVIVFATGFAVPSSFAADRALPPIESVDYDQRGAMRVNGRPFFPILLYDAPTDDATLDRLHDYGFNVLSCRPPDSEALPAKGFYAAVHGTKDVASLSGILLGIGMDSPALNFKTDVLAKTREHNAKLAAIVPGRPIMNAIGYWENEPEGVFNGTLPSKEKYDDLAASIDVAAPYLYPVPYQPVSSVGDAVARARAAVKGTRPVLPILQLFAWKPDDRYPTPAELRCMTMLALVEGASGIGYYSYGHVTGRPKTTIAEAQPGLWNCVRALNREVSELGPKLIAGEPIGGLTLDAASSSPVRMKGVWNGDDALIVVVNAAATEQVASLRWSGSDVPKTLTADAGEGVSFSAGTTATVRLGPFGVAILRGKRTARRL